MSDDERVGKLLRLLRRRSRMSQRAVAGEAGLPREDVMRVEAGLAGAVPLDRLRRMFQVVGGRGRFGVWWNGAAADRLLDERHAALVERAVGLLRRRGWTTAVEVSFSEYGERGSIDVFAGHAAHRAVAVAEVKSDLGSSEELHRMLDIKTRLAPKLAVARFGWSPRVVGRLLIVPDDSSMRRLLERHVETMSTAYPARGRDVRRWLRTPTEPIRGIWFLSEVAQADRGSRPRQCLRPPVAVDDR